MSFTNYLHKLVFPLIILLLAYLPLAGQTPYVFRHLKVENGLSNNNVKTILKDCEGFLWIGTANGLNRYDGYSFKVYQPKEKDIHSLLSNDIWNLQEDGLGNLWIGSEARYCIYDRDKDNFITDIPSYLLKIGIQINGTYKVHVDKRHNLWVLQGQNAFYFNFSHKTLKTFKIENFPEETPELSISDDGENLYLLWNSTLLKLENNAKKCKRVDNISLPSNSIIEKHIYIDYHGGIWLYSYTDEQIFYKKNIKSEWNQINLHSKIETKSNAVRSILDDSNGHVWIGTDHKGVFIYDYVNDNLVNLLNTPMSSTSLASNRINTIYRDDSGVIWLGNFKKGVSYYHESFHEFIDTQHKECGDIASILEDKAGNIWLGTDGNGLYVKEKQKGFAIRKLSIPDIAIISLLEDHKGRIWAGSYQDGLFCYENNSIRHFTPENSQLPYSGVWSMKEDRYGNLWIGYVLETLVCFNPDANTATSYLLPDGNNINVLNICYDYGDKMYIGTTYGLCVMDIVTRKPEMIYANRKETQPFKQLFISTVFKDDRDILWLAHKQGLTAWDLKNDSLHWFDVNNGLCDNLINSITQDNHGNMWLATSNGLSNIDHTISFCFMCEVENLNMSFDPVKIKKVMNNLLSNAFKYTPDKGEINVHLYREDDNVCICVADNGQGIIDKDKKHIFERFYQVQQTSEKTGSGIGLHIANEYVHLHKGTISVTDNFPKGSVFTVKLPIVTYASEKEELLPELLNNDKAPNELPVPNAEELRYTILLVDDNKDFCSFMSEYLSDEYAIQVAYNGAEALKILEKNSVNIVISDIMMPVMNGTELCRQIKTNMQWSHIPVILLTARMAEEYKSEGFEQGADDYIVKPFDFKLLKLRIRKFIEWTEKSHRKFSQKIEVTPNEITITPLDEQFIEKAIKIVEERMSDSDFSVEMLGAELGLSRSHLYKKLMCITGKGPAEFIRIIRLKRSKQLLKESQKQIAEIAYEVGFSSPKRFTVNFKNEFGISPSDYIRSLK